MKRLRIGLVQNKTFVGKIKENFDVYYNQILSLINRQANIIITPELFLTGFDYNNIQNYKNHIDNYLIEFINIVPDNTILALSLPEYEANSIYNTTFFINNNGILAKYRKNLLFSPAHEDKYFTPSNNITIFCYDNIKISTHTCYEIRFPELFRLSFYEGAEIFIVPAVWPEEKIDHWLALLKSRAIENQAFVIGCNCSKQITKNKELICGYSAVFDPWGENLFLANKSDYLEVIELDINKVKEVRKNIPCLEVAKTNFQIGFTKKSINKELICNNIN
ncbi:hypothetical protein OWM07_05245 [Deferribacter thermophilus]|uniref:nitrilase-related carbon-nitrogen hydrolase n=1 Tax=Deferribacter thermophilus TaxID=53573 RepID=UPI003C1552E7